MNNANMCKSEFLDVYQWSKSWRTFNVEKRNKIELDLCPYRYGNNDNPLNWSYWPSNTTYRVPRPSKYWSWHSKLAHYQSVLVIELWEASCSWRLCALTCQSCDLINNTITTRKYYVDLLVDTNVKSQQSTNDNLNNAFTITYFQLWHLKI